MGLPNIYFFLKAVLIAGAASRFSWFEEKEYHSSATAIANALFCFPSIVDFDLKFVLLLLLLRLPTSLAEFRLDKWHRPRVSTFSRSSNFSYTTFQF